MNEMVDVVYEEVNDSQAEQEIEAFADQANVSIDSHEFVTPAPFVRNYRRDVVQKPTHPEALLKIFDTENIKEKMSEQKSKDSNEVFVGIRRSIRKSIRNWMHPTTNSDKKDKLENRLPSHIMSTIRHSLRRKQPKQPLATSTPCASLNDISIIVDIAKPRTVFKDQNVVAMNSLPKDLSRNKLRSSLRKSSRNVMKTVFKKNIEDFNLGK